MTNYPPCIVDGRPVHDAGNLCAACWADLEHDLTEVFTSLADDLDITLAGLGRTGGSPIGIVVRSASRGVGFDERAGDLARQLHNTLGGWVRVIFEDQLTPALVCSICLVEQRHHAEGPAPRERFWYLLNAPMDVRDDPADLARWLRAHEREVRRHEAVGELWQEVHDLIEQVRRVVTPRSPRIYLGVCSAPLNEDDDEPELCDQDLYAAEGARSIKCPKCWVTHQIDQRREVMLAAVAEQLATAVECSRALTAMTGVDVSVNTIRSWAARGKLAQHPPREGERWPRYRVGDVEELLKGLATRRPA